MSRILQYPPLATPVFTTVAAPLTFWQAAYPDRVPAAASAIPALGMVAMPILPPPTPVVSGTVSATVISAPVLIQYQDVTAPPTTVIDVQSLSWTAKYPDRVPGLPVPPWEFHTAALSPAFPVPHLSWAPMYPVWIDRREIHASKIPYGPDAPPSVRNLDHVGWLPWYPNWIDALPYRVANSPTFTTGATPSVFPVPELSWTSVYPDQIWQVSLQTANRTWLALEPFPRPADVFSPSVVYPDWLPPIRSVAWKPAWQSGPLSPSFPVPFLSWEPEYPDHPDRLVVLTANQPSFTTGQTGSTIPLGHIGWKGLQPDTIDRVTLSTANQTATFSPRYLPINDLRWKPIYPDQIDRLLVRGVDQPFFTTGQTGSTIPLGHLGWLPWYPDTIDVRRLLAELQQAFTGQPISVIPLGHMGWEPEYPDKIDRLTFLAALQQVVALNPYPIAQPEAPFLSWGPEYPDAIDRRVLSSSAMLVSAAGLWPFSLGYVGWLPQYPDWILRRLPPEGASVSVLPRPTGSLDWLSFYPDFLSRLWTPDVGVTGSIFPQVPSLSWRGWYPDWLRQAAIHASLIPAFTIDTRTPVMVLSAWGWYPDVLNRQVLPVSAMPTLSQEPFPRPGDTALTVWLVYPDRITRLTLHPSQLPFFVPGPLVPIPNIGGGKPRIILGQNESIAITIDPQIGGWSW